jgi:hypothetical protein
MIRISWDDLNPVVHFGLYFKTEPTFKLGPNYTSKHNFIYIVKGKADVMIQGQAYDATTGDLFYTGPEVSYMYQAVAEDPFELIGINFSLTGPLPKKFHEMPDSDPVCKGDIERPNLLYIGEPGLDELLVPQHTVIDYDTMHPLFLKLAAQKKKEVQSLKR